MTAVSSINVFPISVNISKHDKTFVYYNGYGVKEHNKGLVDAMSGFGLKTLNERRLSQIMYSMTRQLFMSSFPI